ncbi:hypothetical protein FOA52_012839 [Chlamydomonas sp. UWO 241]|nr:hypothetical protein FOA52_012839 [Chlamydomonas sp. UWO 241]
MARDGIVRGALRDASYLGSTRHVRRLFSDCYGPEETAVAAAAVRVAAAAVDGVSLPVCLAMNLVRFVHDVSGRDRPAGGGVVSASFLNAKPAVGGIGVEPRRGGVLRVLFTVASDAVADTVVRSRRNLRDVDPSAAVFDVLSDREEAQHRALWPAFLAAKAAGKRAQFHRARLVVDGERVEIRWGSFVSRLPVLELAVKEAVSSILASIGTDSAPQLAIVFVTSSMGAEFDQVVPLLRQLLPSLKNIVGCSGYGVIGGGPDGPNEVEGEQGFSLSLGQLPGVDVHVLQTLRSSIPEPSATMQEWSDFVGVPYDTPQEVSFMILADPRFTQVKQMVEGLDYAFPDSVKIGGLLSTGTRPRARALFAWSADDQKGARGERGGAGARGDGAQQKRRRRGRKPREVIMLRETRGGGALGEEGGSGDEEEEAKRLLTGIRDDIDNTRAGSNSNSDRAAASSASDGGAGAASNSAGVAGVASNSAGVASSAGPSTSGGAVVPKDGGFFGGLMRMFTGGKDAGSSSSVSSGSGSGGEGSWPAQAAKSSSARTDGRQQRGGRAVERPSDSSSEDLAGNGMYLHGAVVLVLHGNVKLDVITSMGFRSPSNRLFRVESLNRPNEIVTVTPDMSVDPEGSGRLVQLLGSDDSDDDDSDNEVQAVVAIVDMLEALGEEFEGNVDELLDSAIIAVARDSGKASSELTHDDFEMVQLEGIAEEYGMLVVGDRLRKGDRFKVMIRDEAAMKDELRERILAYKRKDLQAMLGGGQLPPTFGCIMFTDVDRGTAMYAEESYEARMLSTYLPTPISGLFAGGQICRFNESHIIMENVCIAGILRAAEPRAAAAKTQATAASAAAYAQQEGLGEEDGEDSSSEGGEGESEEEGGDGEAGGGERADGEKGCAAAVEGASGTKPPKGLTRVTTPL